MWFRKYCTHGRTVLLCQSQNCCRARSNCLILNGMPLRSLLFVGGNKGRKLFVLLDAGFLDELGNEGLGLFDAGHRLGRGGFFVHESVPSLQYGLERSDQRRGLLDVSDAGITVRSLLDGFHDEVLGVSTVKGWVLVEGLDTGEGRFELCGVLELANQFVEGGSEEVDLLHVLVLGNVFGKGGLDRNDEGSGGKGGGGQHLATAELGPQLGVRHRLGGKIWGGESAGGAEVCGEEKQVAEKASW
mmetsp:Transcript_10165/g.29880  ORF Transcript_10165/g.29880 Transcript_10165/m.29880 type:complete len:244 (+) Transcript_10165:185-916(+)